jgi:PAS domain S-box-containing protein
MGLQNNYISIPVHELLCYVEDLVLVVDSRLKVVEASRSAELAFGYPMGDLAEKTLTLLLAPAERDRMVTRIREAEERQEGETIFIDNSGRYVPARFSLSPIAGAETESPFYLFVGHRSEGPSPSPEAGAPNGLAARLLKGFADPLFIIDGPSRLVIECNEATLATLGYPREELIGKRLMDRGRSPGERRKNKAMEERATKIYATVGIFQERMLFPRKDGSPLPCDLTGLPFFKEDGSLDLIIVMLFDRSAEEESEAELAELIEQIGELSVKLGAEVARFSTRGKRNRLSDLGFTPRQIEIARQCATGAPSKEIGFRLGIAESTVKNHLAVMYRKLGVNSKIGFLRLLDSKRIRIE